MISSRFTLAASLAVLFLAGCGGSQPLTGTPATAAQPATSFQPQSVKGFYLATFTTEVGSSLPESSLCLWFKRSGKWSSVGGSESFNGRYLTSGKALYAFGIWLPSPAVYMSLQGSVSAKRGSGTFVVSSPSAYVTGGGTFTMIGKQSKTCS
jgi:hypothetical protein